MDKTTDQYELAKARVLALLSSSIYCLLHRFPDFIPIDSESLQAAVGKHEGQTEALELLQNIFMDLSGNILLPLYEPNDKGAYWKEFPSLISKYELQETDSGLTATIWPNYDNFLIALFHENALIPYPPFMELFNLRSPYSFWLLNLLRHWTILEEPLSFGLSELTHRLSLPVLFDNASWEELSDVKNANEHLAQYVQTNIVPLLDDIKENANDEDCCYYASISLRNLYIDKNGTPSISFTLNQYASDPNVVAGNEFTPTGAAGFDPVGSRTRNENGAGSEAGSGNENGTRSESKSGASQAPAPGITSPTTAAMDALMGTPRQKVKVRAKRSATSNRVIPFDSADFGLGKSLSQITSNYKIDPLYCNILLAQVRYHPLYKTLMEELAAETDEEASADFFETVTSFLVAIIIDLGYRPAD